MSINILMPSIGAGASEGKLLQWLKQPGDAVAVGDVVAEIETEKAVVELEALDAGILEHIVVPPGSSDIAVGAVIGVLRGAGEVPATAPCATPAADPAVTSAAHVASVSATASTDQTRPAAVAQVAATSGASDSRHFASPSAKRRGRELGVDVTRIFGSGPKGRVVRADVEKWAQQHPATAIGAHTSQPSSPARTLSTEAAEILALTPMRRAIARRLLESKQTVPHFYLRSSCSVEQLQTVRQALNARLKQSGEDGKISVNDLIVHATARALAAVPQMNMRWTDQGIEVLRRADIGVAIALDDGLVTPIVEGADEKGLLAISQEIKKLGATARQGRLKLSQLEGGSLTVSNLGMYGVDEFAAIINPPQSAILAVGQIKDQVTLDDSTVRAVPTITLTLSVDHRVIDGAVGARFLGQLKALIETPSLLIL